MDNRDKKDFKYDKPTGEIVGRTRQRGGAAAAQAQQEPAPMQRPAQAMQRPAQAMQRPAQPMQRPAQPMQRPMQPMQRPAQPMQRPMQAQQAAQMQNPAQAAYAQMEQDGFAPAARKRTQERVLSAPVVFEPKGGELRTPSVKAAEFKELSASTGERSMGIYIVIAILMGIASGVFLLWNNGSSGILMQKGLQGYSDGGLIAFCLIWGGVLGLLYGLVLSFVHVNLPSGLPTYAALLFLPLLMLLLTPLMATAVELLIALVQAVLGLIGAGIGLFLVWTFVCGG